MSEENNQPQGEPVVRYSMDQTGCDELDPESAVRRAVIRATADLNP